MDLKARREGKGCLQYSEKITAKVRVEINLISHAIATHSAGGQKPSQRERAWKEEGENDTESPSGVRGQQAGGEPGRAGKDRRTWR